MTLNRLNKLLGDVVISQGGVVPFINPEVSHCAVGEIGDILTGFPCSSCPAKHKKARRRVRRFRHLIPVSLLYYYTYRLSYFCSFLECSFFHVDKGEYNFIVLARIHACECSVFRFWIGANVPLRRP